jgi:predicted RNase H-like HicB family nuclease
MRDTINKQLKMINISLDIFYLNEDGIFTAYCPALELSSYGSSIRDAQAAFDEALEIFVDETIKKGTLEKVLLKLGWTLKAVPKADFEPPKLRVNDIQRFSHHLIKGSTTKIAIPAYS